MKSKMTIECVLACLVLTMAICVETLTAQGESSSTPAPAGLTVVTTVERGDAYGAPELYDLKITIQEIVRGAKALDLIKQVSTSNRPPMAGFVYILARIRVEYSARGLPGDQSYELGEGQFAAVSADGKEYKIPSIVQPKPRLIGNVLHPGDSCEGWVVFLVPEDDEKPLLSFRRDPVDGGIYGIWRKLWFRLY